VVQSFFLAENTPQRKTSTFKHASPVHTNFGGNFEESFQLLLRNLKTKQRKFRSNDFNKTKIEEYCLKKNEAKNEKR
jgi:carbamoylphosphate synthase large subunit